MPQSLASLLMTRDSLPISNVILEQPTDHIENHLFREEEKFVPFTEEEGELEGTSEMVHVYESDASISDSTHTMMTKNQWQTNSVLQSDVVKVVSPSISTEINSINVISLHENLQSLERENLLLKVNAQKLLDKIASMEQKVTTLASIQSELASAKAESDIVKLNSKKEREENKLSNENLLSELTYLKVIKVEETASNLIVEQKCNALEFEKRDLLQQIESQKFQQTEKTSLSIGSLDRAERHISQLESENKLLRQLHIDLDAADRDKAQLQRRATTLENEVNHLKVENLQLQRNLHRKDSASNEPDKSFGQYPFPAQVSNTSLQLQSKKDQDYHSSRSRDPEITNLNQGHGVSYESSDSCTDSSTHQKQQGPTAISSWSSATAQSSSVPQRNVNTDSNFSKDGISDVGANLYKDRVPSSIYNGSSSSMKTLANFIGNRERLLSSGERRRFNDNDNCLQPTKARGLDTISNGYEVSSKESHSINSSRGPSPTPATVSSTAPSLVRRNSFNSSRIKSNNSSGGGVSCFYNEDMSETSTTGAARAPFGTDQSKNIDMTSFDDADNRLTALMTEKSVLYEESARLQQKGGKVLKERTRLQQVDVRLIEVGKEIAYQRKILTGKPG